MPFRCTPSGRNVLRAVEAVRLADRAGSRLGPDAPTAFVPSRWRRFVLTDDGVDRAYYELCMLCQLRLALHSGTVWVEGSRKYLSTGKLGLDLSHNARERTEVLDDLGVPASPRTALANKATSLSELARAARAVAGDRPLRVVDGQVHLSPYDALGRSESLVRLEAAIDAHLPRVDLSGLLVEVDRWTSFSEALEHAAERKPPSGRIYQHTMAAILAQACNIGLTRMAEASGATFAQLAWANAWHVTEPTLKTAFSVVVNGHHAQPLSAAWGAGMLSSSDGQRFPVSGDVASARPLPRYFGYGRGVTYYTWTSDQFSQYGTKVIPATSRDATYVLDEILDNETELEVVEHTTDTAGYTDLVFALFDLLGMRFAPRIRDSGSSVLYKLEDAPVEWEALKTARTVRRRVIEAHWDDMLRIAGLLKGGHVTASLLISRLQSRIDTGLAGGGEGASGGAASPGTPVSSEGLQSRLGVQSRYCFAPSSAASDSGLSRCRRRRTAYARCASPVLVRSVAVVLLVTSSAAADGILPSGGTPEHVCSPPASASPCSVLSSSGVTRWRNSRALPRCVPSRVDPSGSWSKLVALGSSVAPGSLPAPLPLTRGSLCRTPLATVVPASSRVPSGLNSHVGCSRPLIHVWSQSCEVNTSRPRTITSSRTMDPSARAVLTTCVGVKSSSGYMGQPAASRPSACLSAGCRSRGLIARPSDTLLDRMSDSANGTTMPLCDCIYNAAARALRSRSRRLSRFVT